MNETLNMFRALNAREKDAVKDTLISPILTLVEISRAVVGIQFTMSDKSTDSRTKRTLSDLLFESQAKLTTHRKQIERLLNDITEKSPQSSKWRSSLRQTMDTESMPTEELKSNLSDVCKLLSDSAQDTVPRNKSRTRRTGPDVDPSHSKWRYPDETLNLTTGYDQTWPENSRMPRTGHLNSNFVSGTIDPNMFNRNAKPQPVSETMATRSDPRTELKPLGRPVDLVQESPLRTVTSPLALKLQPVQPNPKPEADLPKKVQEEPIKNVRLNEYKPETITTPTKMDEMNECSNVGGIRSYNSRELKEIEDRRFPHQVNGRTLEVRHIPVTNALNDKENLPNIVAAENKTVIFVPYYNQVGENNEDEEEPNDSHGGEEGGHGTLRTKGSKRSQMLGSKLSGGSKPAPVSLEITTTKPIEIRMVGLDRKNITPMVPDEASQKQEKGVSIEDIPMSERKAPEGFDYDLNNPSKENQSKMKAKEQALSERNSVISHSIQRIILKEEGEDLLVRNNDFSRNLMRDYSPAKRNELNKIVKQTQFDRVEIHSLDLKIGNLKSS